MFQVLHVPLRDILELMPFLKVSSIWYLVSGIKNKQSLQSSSFDNLKTAGLTKYKILNTKYSKSNGFTLIEFLVVLGILAITVSSTLLFLTSVLRGSNKANVIAEVKQNGQAVLESLERQIRNGVGAEQVGLVENNTVKIIRQDHDPLYIRCFSNVSLNGYIGSVASDTTDVTGPGDLQYISMTFKDDLVSGVDIDCPDSTDIANGCAFRVIPSSAGGISPPVVSVCFYANQAAQAPSRQDFQAKVKFQTTISLRKY